jgi:superfamily II DNA or RNA helicase
VLTSSTGETGAEIDFSTPGLHVRSVFDLAKSGHTTGRVVRHAGRDYTFVRLKSGETAQFPCEHLRLVPQKETRADTFKNFQFAGPDQLQRAVIIEKVRGRLTDVFYSMGSGHAIFYPHQFKPVLKLVSSPGGRILIADEVGLGKTIEAIYVWKELQARGGARRLLIVCPSMLQPKWQQELRERFSIDATIVDANDLLEALQKAATDPTAHFALIGSFEGLRARRPRNDTEEASIGARQRLSAFLAANEESAQAELIDLVIIDEAHYLRNPETATNYFGSLVAGASAHVLLLTATPIQLGSQNLFQLLTLLDADRYANMDVFKLIREANRPIIAALNAVQRIPPDFQTFQASVNEAMHNQFFAEDTILSDIAQTKGLNDPNERIRIARVLENRSLLGDVLTRTRKRDVMQNRVQRNAKVFRIPLSPVERGLYDSIEATLRAQALHSKSAQTLKMIGRLRQLASSVPAAIAGWKEKNTLDEVLWEDLGVLLDAEDDSSSDTTDIGQPDIHALEVADSKYAELRKVLRSRLTDHPEEKIVVFSFYRATLHYLARRLLSDGIGTAMIHGGLGDERHAELRRFESQSGPPVLLSSEVGSEGIDLQFARVLINYDLPWNPMKVEQRIGRIDRLGQKADTIHIINFVIRDTIEEIILDRLLNRLEIFKSSIGELEEVLGQSFDELLVEYFRDGLTDEQLAHRLEQNALAAENHRENVRQLEEEAPQLAGHADFILSNIQKSRDTGRWVTPADMLGFVTDLLLEYHSGSTIEERPTKAGMFDVSLSADARASLSNYIQTTRPVRSTRLHSPGETVPVVFDITLQSELRPKPEFVDLTHPLALWLREQTEYRQEAISSGVAIGLSRGNTAVPPDLYIFATDLWRFEGLHKQIVLRHCVMSLEKSEPLDPDAAEQLIHDAARHGERLDMHQYRDVREALSSGLEQCESELTTQFSADAHMFQLENEQRVRQAEIIAEERAAKRLRMLEERLAGQKQSQDERRRRAIPLTEGQIKRLKADRDQRLARIAGMRHAETASRPVAGGIIIVR